MTHEIKIFTPTRVYWNKPIRGITRAEILDKHNFNSAGNWSSPLAYFHLGVHVGLNTMNPKHGEIGWVLDEYNHAQVAWASLDEDAGVLVIMTGE